MSDEEERLGKKIDWVLQRQLTWVSLLLASCVGIIELLSLMEYFLITGLIIYESLVISIIVCFSQIGAHTREIAEYIRKLPPEWKLSGEHRLFMKKT